MKLRAVTLLLAAMLFSYGAVARAQTPTLKVGLPSLSMFTIMYHIAQDKGFFEKEGVKVEINHFESGSINMKALLARAVDISDVESLAQSETVRICGSSDRKARTCTSRSMRKRISIL